MYVYLCCGIKTQKQVPPRNMKSVLRSAICTTLTFSLCSLNPISRSNFLIPLPRYVAVLAAKPSPFASMAGGDGGSDSPLSPSHHVLEEQFEKFRHQLEDSGTLRERIRSVAFEIESATRRMHSNLLLIHQSRPVPGAILWLQLTCCLVFYNYFLNLEFVLD